MSTDVDRLAYTFAEAATALGVSRQTVARMCANGRLHEVDTGLSVRLVAAWSLHALTAQVASAGSLPREPQGPGSATVPASVADPTTSP